MALIAVLVAIATAGTFGYAGAQMVSLESQAGNTVAEVFYQAMGVFSFGMAGLAILGGIAVAGRINSPTSPTT